MLKGFSKKKDKPIPKEKEKEKEDKEKTSLNFNIFKNDHRKKAQLEVKEEPTKET